MEGWIESGQHLLQGRPPIRLILLKKKICSLGAGDMRLLPSHGLPINESSISYRADVLLIAETAQGAEQGGNRLPLLAKLCQAAQGAATRSELRRDPSLGRGSFRG